MITINTVKQIRRDGNLALTSALSLSRKPTMRGNK